MVEDREEVVTVAVGVGETALDIKMMAIEGITETGVMGEETGDIEGITETGEIEEIGEMADTIEGEEEGDTTIDMMVRLYVCLFIFSVDDR